jgi:hypothetical protein
MRILDVLIPMAARNLVTTGARIYQIAMLPPLLHHPTLSPIGRDA